MTITGSFRTLDDVNVQNQRCLVRVDLNVPIMDGHVGDRTRIQRILPTLRELMDKGAKVILLSHFGRPRGQVVPAMSLKQVIPALTEELGQPVQFASDCVGEVAQAAVQHMLPGEVLVLENTRFYAGEEKNDQDMAKALARLGDIYVNDAFSVTHRAHASTEALARILPCFAGRAMQRELEALQAGLGTPKSPVMAIVGGAKVSTKIELLDHLTEKVDMLVIGGGMANTFLAAQGYDVGQSLCEHDYRITAERIMVAAQANQCEIILPVDAMVADEFKAHALYSEVDVDQVPADGMILDIGSQTVKRIIQKLDEVNTLVWNGPLGAFELSPFDAATLAVARYVAERTQSGTLISVAGGGDTVAALAHAGVQDQFSYVSTAGGAFLEWMEGKVLPGVQVLIKAYNDIKE